jgi:hypothetical protein
VDPKEASEENSGSKRNFWLTVFWLTVFWRKVARECLKLELPRDRGDLIAALQNSRLSKTNLRRAFTPHARAFRRVRILRGRVRGIREYYSFKGNYARVLSRATPKTN